VIDLGVLVIPADLASAIANSAESTGWLGGASIPGEKLYVATSAQIGADTKQSASTPRLRSHRAFQTEFGTISDRILRWLRVGPEFGERFRFGLTNTAALAAALDCEISAETEYLCTIEPTDKVPKIRAFCLVPSRDGTYMLPLDVKILYRADPYLRLVQESTERLKLKSVVVVGLGSGGGEIALQLACAGVGKLVLFDHGRVDTPNYIRHPLTRQDLGRRKVSGVASNLLERDLPTVVVEYFENVVTWADNFRKGLDEHKPDLVVCATDSRESRRFVNYCANRFAVPLVIAGTLDNGRIGEILLAIPSRTACYECVRLELGTALEQPESDGRPSIPYVGGEAEDLQSGAHRFDVAMVASLATRVALQVLDPAEYEPVPTSYILWGRERTSYPPPFNFDFPLSTNHVTVTKRSDCPVCGVDSPELEGVDVESRFISILAEANEIST